MKKLLYPVIIILALLYGCAAGTPPLTAALTISPDASPNPSASAVFVMQSGSPERAPNPSSEMLVTGTVTAVLDSATIQVKADNLSKDLVVTMLNRAQYADGVTKQFKVGNCVRIITSNKLAKTLPERAAAIYVLENN
jgi:hypothetical protein